MNKVILMGRLTRDPDIRYSQGASQSAVARYSLAVDRAFKREGEPEADFINCVAFGRQAEFAERFLKRGIKIAVVGRIQTGSYTNRDGVKVYTTDVIIENQEFAESKAANDRVRSDAGQGADSYADSYGGGSAPSMQSAPAPADAPADGFMNIPDAIDDDLPFH